MSSPDPRSNKSRFDDETSITELTIGPDGRLFLFGASAPVLEAIEATGMGGEALRRRIERLRAVLPAENGVQPTGNEENRHTDRQIGRLDPS